MNAQYLSQLGQSSRIPSGPVGRELLELYGTGPASYSQATGDVINSPAPNSVFLSCVFGGLRTVSGTYYVLAQPNTSNNTRVTWSFHWFVTATNAEVANAVNLSTEVVQFGAIGGQV